MRGSAVARLREPNARRDAGQSPTVTSFTQGSTSNLISSSASSPSERPLCAAGRLPPRRAATPVRCRSMPTPHRNRPQGYPPTTGITLRLGAPKRRVDGATECRIGSFGRRCVSLLGCRTAALGGPFVSAISVETGLCCGHKREARRRRPRRMPDPAPARVSGYRARISRPPTILERRDEGVTEGVMSSLSFGYLHHVRNYPGSPARRRRSRR
jgi:hypothetical protein